MTTNNNNKNTESSQGDGGAPPPPATPPGQTQATEDPGSRGGNTIFKSGPLFISSKGIGWTSWKKRWFILTRTSLVFFRSDPNAIPQKGSEVNLTLGGIDLNNSGSVVVKADKKLLTVLFPDGRDGRAFTLKAETSEDLHEWKNALESALAQAPNAALVMGQNGILKNDQANGKESKDTPSDQCPLPEKPPAKSLVIGRPILLALEDVDGAPSFLEKALRFVEEHGVKVEGIFRQAAAVDDVEHRIREYEQGKSEFSPEEDAHIIGDCIKYFLRELPSSPVPASCCNALLDACRTDRAGRVNAMRTAICETFPEPNRRLLQRILSMMQKVAVHKAENRMSTSAVAACMAPLLLRPLLSGDCEIETDFDVGGDGSIQLLQAAAAANHAQAIVITLLEEYDNIFREGSMTPGLYSDSEDDASEDEEVTDDDDDDDDNDDEYDDEFYDDDEHDDASEESDTCTEYDLDDASGGTCSESGDAEEENLSTREVGVDLVSGSKSPEAVHKSPPSSIEIPLPLHVNTESSRDIPDPIDNDSGTQTNKSGELVDDGSKETTLENMPTGSDPSTCIQKSSSVSNAPERGSRRQNVWGRTSARKNLSTESIDYSFEEDVEIEKLEACKVDLQKKISREVKSNAVLHANLDKRKKSLHEHRQALEQDVARLKEQLQQERDKRTLLEAALNNSQEPLPSNLKVDDKMKVEFEEISQAEGDIINLKQMVNDLSLQLDQQRDQNNGNTYDSRNLASPSNHAAKVKDKSKDNEYATGSPHPGRSSRKDSHTDKPGSDNDKKHDSPSSQSKQSQQSDTGRSSNSRSSTNSRRSSRNEGPTASALTKLTNRLNFLKERRTQIANELQNLDKGRSSNQFTAASDKGKASESAQPIQNTDKSQGSETSSTQEKGSAIGGQTSHNSEETKKPGAQTHSDVQHTENVNTGRSHTHVSSHKDKVQGSGSKTGRNRRTNSR